MIVERWTIVDRRRGDRVIGRIETDGTSYVRLTGGTKALKAVWRKASRDGFEALVGGGTNQHMAWDRVVHFELGPHTLGYFGNVLGENGWSFWESEP